MSENNNMNDKISINEIMKRAQDMQQRLQKIQQELSETTTIGTAGGRSDESRKYLIEVVLNGQRDCKSVKIDPSLLKEDISVLEDLIVAAFNDAIKKVEKQLRDKMGSISGGVLPDDLI